MALVTQFLVFALALFLVVRLRRAPRWGAYIRSLVGFGVLFLALLVGGAFAYQDAGLWLVLVSTAASTVFAAAIYALAGLIVILRRKAPTPTPVQADYPSPTSGEAPAP